MSTAGLRCRSVPVDGLARGVLGKLSRKCSPMILPLVDIFEWDVINWSRALASWEARIGTDLSGARALELGSRNGGLALWLALRGATVVCSDRDVPGDRAHALHRRFGVHPRITYGAVDATMMSFDREFDVIAFKSVLGAMGSQGQLTRQRVALSKMHAALRPSGTLVFAENLAASFIHRTSRQYGISWGRRWRYISEGELCELLVPFDRAEFSTVGFLGAFGRTERQRRVLGRLDRRFDRAIPSSWRYIGIGVASKGSWRSPTARTR